MSYLINTGLTSNTVTWSGTSTTSATPYVTTLNGTNSLSVSGTAKFQDDVELMGDLKIKNKSLSDQLNKIEERLAILHPNEELEEKWEQLRGLRKLYMELEAEIIEKEKMWAILKK
jgi:hypothetical protein